MFAQVSRPLHERVNLAGFRLRTAAAARTVALPALARMAVLTTPHHSPGDLDSHSTVWVSVGVAAPGLLFTYTPVLDRLARRARNLVTGVSAEIRKVMVALGPSGLDDFGLELKGERRS